jgi:hypothetical protein
LGAPDGFAEGFEHVVQRGVAVAVAGLALLEGFAEAGGWLMESCSSMARCRERCRKG